MEPIAEPVAVQVAYATPQEQIVINLRVPAGTTLRNAVALSGIFDRAPLLANAGFELGVFGRVLDPETPARAGDRIEIYRKLIADPKLARRQRAAKSKKLKQSIR